MKAEDYIKDDSDGRQAFINIKGMKMVKSFIAKKGGPTGAERITGIDRNAWQRLRDKGQCHPSTWGKMFEFIAKHHKTAA